LLEWEEVREAMGVKEVMRGKVGMEGKEVMVEREAMEEGMEVICRSPEVCTNLG